MTALSKKDEKMSKIKRRDTFKNPGEGAQGGGTGTPTSAQVEHDTHTLKYKKING